MNVIKQYIEQINYRKKTDISSTELEKELVYKEDGCEKTKLFTNGTVYCCGRLIITDKRTVFSILYFINYFHKFNNGFEV